MAESVNPAASHHLPSFITPPGETDVLMVIMAIVLVLAVLGFGLLFFRLHTLPERMAHKSQKLQFEIVAVLGLIALFTHMHIFWIIGLILAFIEIPDFGTPLRRIAGSVEKIAGVKLGEGAAEMTPPDMVSTDKKVAALARHGDAAAMTPEIVPKRRKEPDHA
jgi:hypothetical protein